jgi:DNA-binding MarR family transcriptional regulator
VLHAVRLKGFAEPDSIAALWALDEAEVASTLTSLQEDGSVQRRDGRVSGWSLTPEGRARHAEAVAEELAATGTRADIEAAYRRFLEVNPELLGTCTAWQLRQVDGGQAVNDHTDAAYDAGVIERLTALHGKAEPVVGDLAAALDRFARYPVRLAHALERIREGDVAWFTKPLLDSYHTVWFELHEDLLSTLGLQRGAEGRA